MTISAEDINQIVRNVMREMQARTTTVDDGTRAVMPHVTDSDAIHIGSRIISESVLAEAGAAGRAVSLLPGAIVTPSGRDYIRRNGVRLSSRFDGRSTAKAAGLFLTIGIHTTAISAASAAGWKTRDVSTEFEAASIAAGNLTSGIVACCGGEPSVVACLLNRNTAVRAAVVTRTTNLETLITVMNPQVVCLDSSGWSFGELQRLLWGLAETTAAPKDWSELSGGGR